MKNLSSIEKSLEVLKSARLLANYAEQQNIFADRHSFRPSYDHITAILADASLQAGLSYSNVVKPRIERILTNYSEKKSTNDLLVIIDECSVSTLLQWNHPTKIERFSNLLEQLLKHNINTSDELKSELMNPLFIADLQKIDGIGPKTIDYIKCLVGIDAVAVDRHIRSFAKNAGLHQNDYSFLHDAFCSAADLLSIPRRAFDYWVWKSLSESTQLNRQQPLF